MVATAPGVAKVPRFGTQLHLVYTVLSELPGVPMTSREVADETGLSLKHCSKYLADLARLKLAGRDPRPLGAGAGRMAHLYWIGERSV